MKIQESEFDAKEWIESYKESQGISVINHPVPNSYILAVNNDGMPIIYALKKRINQIEKWLIVDRLTDIGYMFKDDGTFGYTDDKSDVEKNSFDYIDEAIECFHKFYKK